MPQKQKNVTGAELAILSLLAEQSMHGYQIEQVIEERQMREWTTIGFSSIYYILEKLKKVGWLECKLVPSGGKGPARNIFSLTENGRKIWKEAVIDTLSHPKRQNSNFQLGLSNIQNLETEEALDALKNYRKELDEIKLRLQKRVNSYGKNLPWHVASMFDLSLMQITTELNWLKAFIVQIETRNR